MAIYYGDGSNSNTGRVVQTIFKPKTSSWASSVGSSEVVPTGMYQTITTKTNSSKVLVEVKMSLIIAGSYYGSQWKLMRDSGTDQLSGSPIFVAAGDGNRDQATQGLDANNGSTSDNVQTRGCTFLDTPGNAGAYTYYVVFRDTSTDNFFYLNRGRTDDNNVNQPRSVSSILLQEIAAT
tara:strand:- start:107 stop:643 length:537 start_codon:yes stop_codon:yes gene_type:complete